MHTLLTHLLSVVVAPTKAKVISTDIYNLHLRRHLTSTSPPILHSPSIDNTASSTTALLLNMQMQLATLYVCVSALGGIGCSSNH